MPKAAFYEDPKPGVIASLPGPDKIDDKSMAERAHELLREAYEVKTRCDRDKTRLEEITSELTAIVRGYELPGLRHGRVGFLYSGERSNKFLDKGMLLENGVSPEIIQRSYRDTAIFSDARLVILKAPMRGG